MRGFFGLCCCAAAGGIAAVIVLAILLFTGCSIAEKRLERAGSELLGITDEEKREINQTTINVIDGTTKEAVLLRKSAIQNVTKRTEREAGRFQKKICTKLIGLEYKEVECE